LEVRARVPLKVIISGEHAAVYGYPAVSAAIGLSVRVRAVESDGEGFLIETELDGSGPGRVRARVEASGELSRVSSPGLRRELRYVASAIRVGAREFSPPPAEVRIECEAPPASGLGTSAAVSAGVLAALAALSGEELDRERLRRLVRRVELDVQGKASWVDSTTVTYGGVLSVSGREFRRLECPRDPVLVVAYSGRPSRTGEMVERVRRLVGEVGDVGERVMEVIGEVVSGVERALEEGDLERLGRLLDVNHGLLAALGVSTRELEEVVHALRGAGALGAKVTGAGGGGCAVGVFEDVSRAEAAAELLELMGYRAHVTRPSPRGVRISG